MSGVRAVTDADVDDVVRGATGTVVLSFGASWCGPCVKMAPVVAELAARLGDRVTFLTLDVDAAPRTSQRYDVTDIPTLAVVRDGELVGRLVGARPKPVLLAELEDLAGLAPSPGPGAGGGA